MLQKIIFILTFLCVQAHAQFQFTGNVNAQYTNATAYLSVVEDYHKAHLFLSEYIIAESKIDSTHQFQFKGDFLKEPNQIYSIHIDNCPNAVGDYVHALNHCEDGISILFIANNTDTIYFPLNNLNQPFCSAPKGKKHTTAIQKIDSLQEQLLANLQFNKSDKQRNITYKNSFKALQKYSTTFNEPLVELYAFEQYSDNTSIYHSFYLKDIEDNTYYSNLLNRLQEKYPKSTYTTQFKNELYPIQNSLLQTTNYKTISYVLGILLIMSILLNFFLLKRKTPPTKVVDYKTILTPQEQKILVLMHQKLTNKEIANTLFISISTVKTHINKIYHKLNISSRKEIDHFI